jgi:hypothetical protein
MLLIQVGRSGKTEDEPVDRRGSTNGWAKAETGEPAASSPAVRVAMRPLPLFVLAPSDSSEKAAAGSSSRLVSLITKPNSP